MQLVRAAVAVGGAHRAAHRDAREPAAPRRRRRQPTVYDGPQVEVTAAPVIEGKAPEYFLVSFRALHRGYGQPGDATSRPPSNCAVPLARDPASMDEVRMLRLELQSTTEAFEAANEELKAANEEATSMNEELQSTNEELETSKEELQSVNEELTTVNNQLQAKIAQLEATTNDLANLLGSTDIAVIFLDAEFRVRRFTPAINDLIELIDTDIGRPITDLAQKFTDDKLLADARAVLQKLVPMEREVRSHSGRWYLRRTLPYRTAENHIEGVVVTFVDIAARKRAEDEIIGARERLQAVLEQMPTAVVITAGARPGACCSPTSSAAAMFGYSFPTPVPGDALPGVLSRHWPAAHGRGSLSCRRLAAGARAGHRRRSSPTRKSPCMDAERPRRWCCSMSAAPVQRCGRRRPSRWWRPFSTSRSARHGERGLSAGRRALPPAGGKRQGFRDLLPRHQGPGGHLERGAERILGWTEAGNHRAVRGAILFTPEDRAALRTRGRNAPGRRDRPRHR